MAPEIGWQPTDAIQLNWARETAKPMAENTQIQGRNACCPVQTKLSYIHRKKFLKSRDKSSE